MTRAQMLAQALQNNTGYQMGQGFMQQGMQRAYSPGQAIGNAMNTALGLYATKKARGEAEKTADTQSQQLAKLLTSSGFNVPQGVDPGMALPIIQAKSNMDLAKQGQQFQQDQFKYRQGQDAQSNQFQQDRLDLAKQNANQESWNAPMEVRGPDGNPMLIQTSNLGNQRPVEGYGPKGPLQVPGRDIPLPLEVAAQKAEIAGAGKDKWETVEGPDGKTYQVNMNTNERKALPKGDQMTEGQSNSATYADRVFEVNAALENFDPALMTDTVQHAYSKSPGGNYLMTPEYQQYTQLKRNFVNAVLRKESGAVISDAEFANAEQQYFPQPGDSDEVIAQKAKNRATVAQGLARSAGSSYKPPILEVEAPAQRGKTDLLSKAGWGIEEVQ
ncbi:hypothetical protein [Thalassospira alkalitolerans]|uniref:hypothetical protein n=1 Tax=Thalassospira alkalitolerans TaxID=1293890 RepID=UPI003AA86FFA